MAGGGIQSFTFKEVAPLCGRVRSIAHVGKRSGKTRQCSRGLSCGKLVRPRHSASRSCVRARLHGRPTMFFATLYNEPNETGHTRESVSFVGHHIDAHPLHLQFFVGDIARAHARLESGGHAWKLAPPSSLHGRFG